eukprot:gene33792-39394_t
MHRWTKFIHRYRVQLSDQLCLLCKDWGIAREYNSILTEHLFIIPWTLN